MAKTPSPIPMPTYKELFTGMTLLVIVGGFAVTRGDRSARIAPQDTNAITAGVLNGADEIVVASPSDDLKLDTATMAVHADSSTDINP